MDDEDDSDDTSSWDESSSESVTVLIHRKTYDKRQSSLSYENSDTQPDHATNTELSIEFYDFMYTCRQISNFRKFEKMALRKRQKHNLDKLYFNDQK